MGKYGKGSTALITVDRYPRIGTGPSRRNPDMARDLEMVSNDDYVRDKFCGSYYYCGCTLSIVKCN